MFVPARQKFIPQWNQNKESSHTQHRQAKNKGRPKSEWTFPRTDIGENGLSKPKKVLKLSLSFSANL